VAREIAEDNAEMDGPAEFMIDDDATPVPVGVDAESAIIADPVGVAGTPTSMTVPIGAGAPVHTGSPGTDIALLPLVHSSSQDAGTPTHRIREARIWVGRTPSVEAGAIIWVTTVPAAGAPTPVHS
jgi:hypothetical protein